MLEKTLEKLGFKKEHTDVYLSLLENGVMSAGNLAKRLNIPRTTLYGLLEDLAQGGLILQSEKDNIKLWQAVDPENIKNLINDRINSLENTRSDFDGILEKLKSSQKTDFISPKFNYFEGAEEMRRMLKNVLLYDDLDTELCWPAKDMIKVVGEDFLFEFNKKRVRNNINIRVIWPMDKSGDIKKDIFLAPGKEVKREVRIAPEGIDFSMGYWAYGNKVIFMSSKKENFGFVVESKELRQLLKTQFEILWNISKPLTEDEASKKAFINSMMRPTLIK
ncbi:MAG: helix-turn-helix domain-containing protein [Candidatus Falkowbacteria bacterium]|nr:helix-turn-helix domain-containing protein [Candidatus Falkowbacteria bacterium]